MVNGNGKYFSLWKGLLLPFIFMAWPLLLFAQPINKALDFGNSGGAFATQLLSIEDTIYLNYSRRDLATGSLMRGFIKIGMGGDTLSKHEYTVAGDGLNVCYKSLAYINENLYLTSTSLDTSGDYVAYLYKCKRNGDTLWTRRYEAASGQLIFNSIIAHPLGGFAVLGFTKEINTGHSDIILVRLDSLGNELWRKTYGTPGKTEQPSPNFVNLNGEEYIMGGGELAYPPDYPQTPYYFKTFFLKLKNNGQFERINMSRPNQSEMGVVGLRRVQDGNYVFASRICDGSIHYNVYSKGIVLKVDSNGSEIWSKEVGAYGKYNTFGTIQEDADGNLIVGGRKSTGGAAGTEAAWVVRMSPDGEVLNQTVFYWPGYPAGTVPINLNDMLLLEDGRVAMCGEVTTDKQRIWFVLSDYNGCFTQECSYLGEEIQPDAQGFSVYPNPAESWLYVYNPYAGEALDARLVDMKGNTVAGGIRLFSETTASVYVEGLAPGMYFLSIGLPGGERHIEKIIKQ